MLWKLNLDVQELSLRQIMVICGGLYVACLPFFAYAKWSYVPRPQPDGAVVEKLTGFKRAPDGRYFARTFRFVRERHIEGGMVIYKDFTKPMPLVVYEDMTELPPERYEVQKLTPSDAWRYVWLTGAGGDPRENGKRYYVVLPREISTESAAR